MKKRVIAFITAAVLAVCLVGCAEFNPSDYGVPNVDSYVTLGTYKGVSYKDIDYEVTDKDIEEFIHGQMSDYAETVYVTDRAAANGDNVRIDYVGYIDGETFEGGSDSNADVVLGSGVFLPDLENGIVGMMPGTTQNINVTFPEDYSFIAFRGLKAVFEVTLDHIAETKYPELTDEIVKDISDYETVAQYMDYANTSVTVAVAEELVNYRNTMVWNAVLENCTITGYPTDLIAEYKDNFIQSYRDYANYVGITLESFLSENGLTMEILEAYALEDAQSELRSQMVLISIAKAEGIQVSDAEFHDNVNSYYQSYGKEYFLSTDSFIESYGRENLRYSMLKDKVIDFLVANAVAVK